MKLRYLFIFVIILLNGSLFITNPDKEMHQAFIKDKLTSIMDQKMGDELNENKDPNLKFLAEFSKNIIPVISDKIVTYMMDTHIRRENYYLFSTIQILYHDQWKTIGLGIFDKIFLFPKVEEEIQKVDFKKEFNKLLQNNP
ncbi:DUF4359 domain-containing protein [Apibacter mensalis]|uniref:DUF4359 domain-containing protein n=1 Tax=Apibacter mensalis TaxID=1586267 RepID=UPI0026EB9495|nr:DUF4359 domain-containing protein [Apibacter mensalis]